VGLKGFRLLFSSIMAIVKSIYVFFSVFSDYKYIKVFKLLVYLGVEAYLTVLPKGLYCRNLLLLEGLFGLKVVAFYKVFIEFLFRLL